MAEIEITTSGELKLAGDVVGRITWDRPFIESEVAGLYDDRGDIYDEAAAPFECSPCGEKEERLKDIEETVVTKIANQVLECRKAVLNDASPIAALDAIDAIIADMEFGP